MSLEVTSPLDDIGDADLVRLSELFSTHPDDLTKPLLEEIVALQRANRARRISAEKSVIKPRATRAPKDPDAPAKAIGRPKKAAESSITAEIPTEDEPGF